MIIIIIVAFLESQTLQMNYLAPYSSLCYVVPETIMNSAAYMVWPDMLNTSDLECKCLPHVEFFKTCSCKSNYMVNISSNGSACFYNLTPAMNGTLVHFEYLIDICTSHLDCRINCIISSHKIIILGM